MAKSVEIARARERKKREAQAQKERELWLKVRKPLLIAAAVIVAALVAWAIFSALYVPANGVRVSGGSTVGTETNWLVANLGTTSKPSYYHLGNMDDPEGYTLDPDYSVNSDANVQTRFYNADDASAVVQQIYASGVANYTAQAMAERVIGYGMFTTSEGPTSGTIAGTDVVWVYGKLQSTDDSGNSIEGVGTSTLYVYTDTIKGSSLVLSLTSAEGSLDNVPTAEELVAAAEPIVAKLSKVQ